MKFLIYGAGVIGSIFAGKLASVGYNVTVLARNQRYEDMTANGIILQNAYSDRKEVSKVRVIDHLEPSDVYDYILVIMQKTQVNSVLPYLAKNQSENIVFVVNNPLGYDEWLKCIGQKRLMIGFPAAGGELKNGVVNYFIGRGIARAFQTTTFGELDGKTTSRLTALVKALNRSHIPTLTSSNMDAWQKTHVALVTSIANALYIHKSNNYALSKSTKDIQLMIQGIKEGFQVIEALGYKVTPRKLHYFKLPVGFLSFIFKIIMSTKIAEVTMSKHTIVAHNEMELLQKEFDELIKKSNRTTPYIDKLRKYI